MSPSLGPGGLLSIPIPRIRPERWAPGNPGIPRRWGMPQSAEGERVCDLPQQKSQTETLYGPMVAQASPWRGAAAGMFISTQPTLPPG